MKGLRIGSHSLPFKGRVGVGMGYLAFVFAPHKHKLIPAHLQGEVPSDDKSAGPVLREIAPIFTVDRKFGLILLLSACLHSALFAIIWYHRQPSSSPQPPQLLASIRLLPSPAVAPHVEAPAPQRTQALPPQARQPMIPKTQRSTSRESLAAGPAIASAAMPAHDTQAAPAVETAPSAKATPAPSAKATPAPSVNALAEAAADALAAYRRQLSEAFAREHSYPRIAAMRGWEGEVRLRLKVARKGNLLAIALERSSGFDVLDRDALALLESYGQLPPLPDALDSSEISVVVPINYKLKKTT